MVIALRLIFVIQASSIRVDNRRTVSTAGPS
jgi:hypothetical protein